MAALAVSRKPVSIETVQGIETLTLKWFYRDRAA
jgi:hypothetical protein